MTHDSTSTVLVAGATGRTGREILRELTDETAATAATDASVRVRAMTRSAANRDSLLAAGADEVVVGDLLDQAAARAAVENCDAALFAAGLTLTTGLLRPGRVVDGTGVRNLVEAAVDAGVRRFVLQSTIGAGDSRRGMPLWARAVVLRWTVREKNRAERALVESGLEYAIVRPGWLTDEPATNDVLVTESGGTTTGSIPRADVARLLVAALDAPATTNRTFEVVAGADAENVDPRRLVAAEWAGDTTTPVERDAGRAGGV
ncbi:SDR family oxidoreductase [Halosolutus gelatinilyticus]|uniref:SDR family oxidoreductase n=1 Tax=Halosolutus gelatinilyticus TaxID=2931975 RepID=UPI001FF16886|nr:SDR family oxidoreductase [Halosolutus gelatinilyticus]